MRRILSLIVLATLAACGGSDSTAPSNSTQGKTFTGTYVLQSVNGKTLPYTSYFAGDSLTIRSYSLSIGSGGNWTSTTSEVFTTNGQVTDQPNGGQSGTYTYDASTKAVTIISQDQSTYLSGNVSADFSTLTVSESTDLYVFKK
jgi:hypothetical protein